MAFYRNRLPKKEGEKAAQYHGSVFFSPPSEFVSPMQGWKQYSLRVPRRFCSFHTPCSCVHTHTRRETYHALGRGQREITRMLPLLVQGKSSHVVVVVVVEEVGGGEERGKRDLLCPVFRNPSSSSSSSFHGVAGGPRGMEEGKLRTSPGYGARNGEEEGEGGRGGGLVRRRKIHLSPGHKLSLCSPPPPPPSNPSAVFLLLRCPALTAVRFPRNPSSSFLLLIDPPPNPSSLTDGGERGGEEFDEGQFRTDFGDSRSRFRQKRIFFVSFLGFFLWRRKSYLGRGRRAGVLVA